MDAKFLKIILTIVAILFLLFVVGYYFGQSLAFRDNAVEGKIEQASKTAKPSKD